MSNASVPVVRLWEDAVVTIPKGPYPYSGFQTFGLAILVFFPLLSLVVCGFRIYSRILVSGFGLDDWLIFVATTLAIPQAVISSFVIKTGYWGIHDRDVPPNVPSNLGVFWILVNGLIYTPTFALVKISALIFILRLGDVKKRVRVAGRAIIAINMVIMTTFFPLLLFQCTPVNAAWMSVPGSSCPVRKDGLQFALGTTNILTDFLTLSIPFILFLNLKVNKRVRNALLAVFLLGALVTVMSSMRLYFNVRIYYMTPEDRHYSLGYVCTCIELNLGIVTASVPSLWPLARRWAPGMFTSLGIDHPHLSPDIELSYATQPSSTGQSTKQIRSKTTWHARNNTSESAAEPSERRSDSDRPWVGLPFKEKYSQDGTNTSEGVDFHDEEDERILTYHDVVGNKGTSREALR